ncbi:RraA family protein [Streptomyces sp. NPDC059256]|uniref:RraA family protein n=1 Tax=Streptomyces sp. NPDC059256 TaxID=3346794 RepID=UPI0036D1CF18
MSFLIGSDFKRPDSEVVDAFTRVGTAALGHLTDFGFPRGLRPVAPCGPFAGPALTVKIPHVDSTAVHRAMSLIRPGDVVVIDQSGDDRRSSFGGTLAGIAADLGAVAAVCDGSTNDVEEIRELGFPVYSRGVTSLTTRVLSLEGRINVSAVWSSCRATSSSVTGTASRSSRPRRRRRSPAGCCGSRTRPRGWIYAAASGQARPWPP